MTCSGGATENRISLLQKISSLAKLLWEAMETLGIA